MAEWQEAAFGHSSCTKLAPDCSRFFGKIYFAFCAGKKDEWKTSDTIFFVVMSYAGFEKLEKARYKLGVWHFLSISQNYCLHQLQAQFPLPGQIWVSRGWSDTSTAHLSPPVPEGGRSHIWGFVHCVSFCLSALFYYWDIEGEGLFPSSLLMTDIWQIPR